MHIHRERRPFIAMKSLFAFFRTKKTKAKKNKATAVSPQVLLTPPRNVEPAPTAVAPQLLPTPPRNVESAPTAVAPQVHLTPAWEPCYVTSDTRTIHFSKLSPLSKYSFDKNETGNLVD